MNDAELKSEGVAVSAGDGSRPSMDAAAQEIRRRLGDVAADRERDSGCIPGADMAQRDAAGVNGSSRIRFHGAPPGRVMPNGCLGSPVLVLPPALKSRRS